MTFEQMWADLRPEGRSAASGGSQWPEEFAPTPDCLAGVEALADTLERVAG